MISISEHVSLCHVWVSIFYKHLAMFLNETSKESSRKLIRKVSSVTTHEKFIIKVKPKVELKVILVLHKLGTLINLAFDKRKELWLNEWFCAIPDFHDSSLFISALKMISFLLLWFTRRLKVFPRKWKCASGKFHCFDRFFEECWPFQVKHPRKYLFVTQR